MCQLVSHHTVDILLDIRFQVIGHLGRCLFGRERMLEQRVGSVRIERRHLFAVKLHEQTVAHDLEDRIVVTNGVVMLLMRSECILAESEIGLLVPRET